MNQDPICPKCKVNSLLLNSTCEDFICANCKLIIGLYDKSKYRLVQQWVFPE